MENYGPKREFDSWKIQPLAETRKKNNVYFRKEQNTV